MAAAPSPFAAMAATGALIAPAQLARIASAALPGQDAAAYGVPKGLTLRDELARFFRIGQAQWRGFSAAPAPGLEATARFVEALLKDVLGFSDIARQTTPIEAGGRSFPITLIAASVPISVAPASDPIDRTSDALSAPGRRRSAATLAQEYLNAEPAALWGLASNGRCLRLVRDNPSLTRPAFIEFDLAAIFDDEAYADFAALFLLLHRTRFASNDADCPLEHWRDEGSKAGAVARTKLRGGVEAALLLLGQGFLEHPANTALADRLRSGALPLTEYFAALLRLVYRLIFLLAAEDRGLLHPATAPAAARQLYARGYALGRLRDRAVRRAAWDRHHDAWEGLRIVMDALGRGEPRLGLPALGGLFALDSLPDLAPATLANAKLLEAIYRLAWLREPSGPVPVDWKNMESEELGSVYEGLLELVPRLERGGATFSFATEAAEAKGNARKVSGSYYTPDSLVQAMLDSALNPLLDVTVAGAEDPAAALLALRVVDPACGSGHFLLAAARRIAARLAAERTGNSPAPDDYRHALREVMAACVHGVDRNPMAVELTKVALWIESLEPGKPLGLLDANIRCGDALLGLDDLAAIHTGIPDGAYAPLTGDDKAVAKSKRSINKIEREGPILMRAFRPARLATEAARVRALPEETLAQVETKRQAYAAMTRSAEGASLRDAADAWVVAFLAPKRPGAIVPTTRDVWEAAGGASPQGAMAVEVQRLARLARVFHWPLEFPAVLAGDNPGFDLVIGNPPWERIKLQEQEFFAARDPEIAVASTAAARATLIAALAHADDPVKRALHVEFEIAKRTAAASSALSRVGADGRFPLTGRGDVNTYALFAETFTRLTGGRGRAGVIVPSGIATDDTYKTFFGQLVDDGRLESIFSFYEIRKWFPATDDRKEFSLVVLRQPNNEPASFLFSAQSTQDWSNQDRRFTLTADEIARINPNTKTAPVFRSRSDAELTTEIYRRTPVLIEESRGPEGSPWGVSFMAMFHMSNDSGLFRTAAQLEASGYVRAGASWKPRSGAADTRAAANDASEIGRNSPRLYVPLVEGKMFNHYDHRYGDAADLIEKVVNAQLPRPTLEQLADHEFEILPWFYVPEEALRERLSKYSTREWLLGWRDITNRTAERTVIFGAIPKTAVGNNFPIALFDEAIVSRKIAAFYANMCSLVLDFAARTKVGGTHLNYFILEQLPVLPPSAYEYADLEFIVPRVLELTYTSHAMAAFARDLGYNGPPYTWDEGRRANLRAELDAWYARAYGLTRDQLRYILDPADVMGPDYPSETFRVLKKNECARFDGDYRTARLTLAAWDAQASGPRQ